MRSRGFVSASLLVISLVLPRAGAAQEAVPDSCAARIVDYASRVAAGAPAEYLLELSAVPLGLAVLRPGQDACGTDAAPLSI